MNNLLHFIEKNLLSATGNYFEFTDRTIYRLKFVTAGNLKTKLKKKGLKVKTSF